jgi:putative hydrolase of the HAD superfamily
MDAVLFDLYDTFAWSRWGELSDHVADRLGLERTALHAAYDRTRRDRGIGAFGSAEGDMAAVVRAAGIEPDPALIRELTEYERSFLAGGGVTLYEDSVEVAGALRGRGVRTALISNCSHSTIPLVPLLGLDTLLDVVVLSVEAGVAKPDAGVYHAALDRLAVPPEAAVFVDDQTRYCDGAAAVGVETRLIIRPGTSPVEGISSDANGHAVITDLRALLD